MPVTTRPARPEDAAPLAALLNRIIAKGGTTAHQTPFDPARMTRHYIAPPLGISCTVAEEEGELIGFQSLVWPEDEGDPFPEGWAIIASFVAEGHAGKGIGRALFAATLEAARAAHVSVIDATIRADNTGGLAYYGAMGFEDYDRLPNVPLRDGSHVDRIRKRFDL
ncbi:GNAT family N-acetyltransferase [Pseudoroseicyclus tamaricis]|uniref:GNAT family N-acetyltransferase n=1 Tax=Pseudoroseicyclus tamaricis TaxID=2705421 RepID=A0A6B2JWZ3_9RHOB|nr:GNAT family N-acetyltransferase [Pseudoroseicyclus tamaricis]NDV02650.1 GNAT family N-acetyltransferase [Pseudoroseicyclus tamaricis]